MILNKLKSKKLIHPPTWLSDNTCYLTIMGSFAYGVSSDSSDIDVYGFCIPPKNIVFPHLDGEIFGFGKQVKRFEQWQEHHIKDIEERKEYDFQIFNIVKYFDLCMNGNPNMIDSIFTNQNCILHCSSSANLVRENRHLFLTKKCWHTFKGYAFSQLHKMRSKETEPDSNRHKIREKYGFDVKFAYHVVRLLSEIEQILSEGTLDLQEKGRREHMKAIRNGEIKEQDIYDWFSSKELELEKLYHTSSLPYSPDEPKIKQVLIDCLEHHYGSLENCVSVKDKEKLAIKEIKHILEVYKC